MRASMTLLFHLLPLLSAAGCARAPRPATYRVLETHCERCEPSQLARGLAGAEAIDCGHAKESGKSGSAERLKVSECAQLAQLQGRPFRAQMTLPGVDSTVVVTFARAPDGALSMLWYDSDVSGSDRPCQAQVWRTRCARLRPDARDATLLACDPLGDREDFCSEARTSKQTWTDPRDAGSLACKPTTNRQVVCEPRVTSGDPVPYQACAPSRVPAWLCEPEGGKAELFAPGSTLDCEQQSTLEPLYCTGGTRRP